MTDVPAPEGAAHVASSRKNFVDPAPAAVSGVQPAACDAPEATIVAHPIVPEAVIVPPVIGADVAIDVTVPAPATACHVA